MEKMKLNIQLFGASVSLTASATSATDETAITTNQNYINLAIRVQTTKPTWNGNKTAYYQVTTTSQNNGTQTGSKYYFSIGSSSGSGDKTFNVTLGPFDHNADGTLNDVSISVYVKITDSTNRTATKSVVMGTIPRASAIQNITSGTTDFAPTLTWTPYSSTFKYIIRYLYGSWTYQTDWITPNSTNPQTYNGYTITSASIGPYIPNSTSATILASLYTYTSDGQLVGYSDANFTITLNSNVKPTINSRTLTENGSTPSNWGVWVKTKSKVRVQTSASGIYGSTISSIVTTLDGYTYNGADITSNFLNTAGSLVCQTIVTDSRGRQASSSTTISVQDYYNPSFSAVQIQRCDANGNIDDNGAYCYFNFGGSVATCSNQNKGTYRIKYKLHSASTYTEIPAIATNVQSLSTSGFITDDGTQQGTKAQFSTSDTYDFVFSIQDQFTTSTNNQTLDTGFDLMNFNASGKAMAIGKYSEAGANEELLEIGMPTKQITNDKYLTSQYDGNYYWQFNTDATEFRFNKQIVSSVGLWTEGGLHTDGGINVAGNINTTNGGDLVLGSYGSTNDSGDIIWKYSNGNEKTRIWCDNTPDGMSWLPHIRTLDANGNEIRNARLLSSTALELTTQNILELEAGWYFKEGSTGWTENGWPVATWHATLLIFSWGSTQGWKTYFCIDNSNNELWLRSQQWSGWSSWKKIG